MREDESEEIGGLGKAANDGERTNLNSQPAIDTNELHDELLRVGIEIAGDAEVQLGEYVKRLWVWNSRMNLTRHTDLRTFVQRDAWDAWQLASCLNEAEEVLDVGSGGGVPGVLLGIFRPDLQLALCESVAKKARALNDIVAGLGLPIPVYAVRAEELIEDFRFDSLTARAVGPLPKLAQWFHGKWHLFGRLLAIKGPKWPDERGEARHRGLMKGVRLRRLKTYPMLGTDAESTILELSRDR